jgi:hypothetical protein
VKYLLGEHKPGPGVAAPPPCAAHQPEGCAQTSAGGDDDDVVEFSFSLEELMGSSPPGQCSATPSPLLSYGNDACAPAHGWRLPFVQFDPACCTLGVCLGNGEVKWMEED